VWAGAVGVAGAIAIGVLTLTRSNSGPGVPKTLPPAVNTGVLPGLHMGPPPWPAERQNLRARLRALGLPALSHEGTALHTHQHLDVFVHGSRVPIPPGIGINVAERFISPLHTHNASGIVHVESSTVRSFSLAELFGVWGVRLTRSCLGGECGAGRLRIFVNGGRVRDPSRALLGRHDEIVVSFGTLPKPVPSSYSFPAGL
jgi:hypothetical protein